MTYANPSPVSFATEEKSLSVGSKIIAQCFHVPAEHFAGEEAESLFEFWLANKPFSRVGADPAPLRIEICDNLSHFIF